MSSRQEINLSALRARLLGTLQRVRKARTHDELHSEFYIALGMISAAGMLQAINNAASDRLHDLALDASMRRSDELLATARIERHLAQQRAAA